ncbi:MAG: dihydroorotase [Legionella sp.]|nr:dihydroorotase [Legionella sp.]
MQKLVINQPDDWHVHFRDGDFLHYTVPATARDFSRALVMPNLKPPLTTLDAIQQYRSRIMAAVPENNSFNPYMTFYLNESVTEEELMKAANYSYILGAKLYPAGATTNSEAGVKSLKTLYPLLEIMQKHDLVLQIHGEVTHGDIYEREAFFITEHLQPLISNFPELRMVFEHISTKAAVDFVMQAPPTIAATITPHHLLYNRNKLLAGGLRPHYYCLPILKHESDQKALQGAAISGNRKFFAGTDSAPHALNQKETACGCAGIFSAPFALNYYAEFFDELQQLDKLNEFTSCFGAEFYHLPININQIELVKSPQVIPNDLPFGDTLVIPMAAGETFKWSVHART